MTTPNAMPPNRPTVPPYGHDEVGPLAGPIPERTYRVVVSTDDRPKYRDADGNRLLQRVDVSGGRRVLLYGSFPKPARPYRADDVDDLVRDVQLAYGDGYTHAGVASKLGVPAVAVAMAVRLAGQK